MIVLKRDAVAKVVLNNLYKHTQLQDTFGANMLALVDGVPRTLTPRRSSSGTGSTHQIEVVVRRTRYRLRKAEERVAHPARLLKALDALDEVIALIRASPTRDEARDGPDGSCSRSTRCRRNAILDMQLRRLAALERQQIIDELRRARARDRRLQRHPRQPGAAAADRLATSSPRSSTSTATSGARRSCRSTATCRWRTSSPEEDVVVTITRGGYAKRTKTDLYRAQRAAARACAARSCKQDDIVDHFFVTTTHHWLLFFTNKGRVYRAKAYELPEGAATPRVSTWPTCWRSSPDEKIAQVLDIRDYEQAPYLVLATRAAW